MSITKSNVPSGNVTTTAGATSKTVSNVTAYHHGSVWVIELNWSDSSQSFIKVRGSEMEVGGTNEWGSGTKENFTQQG